MSEPVKLFYEIDAGSGAVIWPQEDAADVVQSFIEQGVATIRIDRIEMTQRDFERLPKEDEGYDETAERVAALEATWRAEDAQARQRAELAALPALWEVQQ